MKLGRSGVRIVTIAGSATVIAATTVLTPPAAGAAVLSPQPPVLISSSAAGTPGNAPTGAMDAAWSPDGTKVAFSSTASNLVAGDTPDTLDVFVKNVATGAITKAPVWGQHPAWSPDGASLAFWSGGGAQCVRIMVWRPSATTASTVAEECGVSESVTRAPVWAPSGKRLAADIEQTWSRALWSVDLTGATPVHLTSSARWPAWSATGQLAVAAQTYRGLDPIGDNATYTSDVTVAGNRLWPPVKLSDEFGCPEDGCWSGSWQPAWSPSGTAVAFTSDTPTAADSNGHSDVFTQAPGSGARTAVSTTATGQFGNGASGGLAAADGRPVWSPDGSIVLFSSSATNLVPGDGNGAADVFAKRLGTGAIAKVAAAGTASGPGRWDFAGTWPVYDTVVLPGAASGPWFRSDLWNRADTKVLYPSAAGQLLAAAVPAKPAPKPDVPVQPLATPAVAAVTAASRSVVMRWQQPASTAAVSGYRIQARGGTGAWRTVVANTGTTSTRRTITGLVNGVGYRLRVAALSGARQGSWSVASPRVVPFGTPGRPGRPEASAVSKRRATLAWDGAPANGATVGYQVQKRKQGIWVTLASTARLQWRGKLGPKGSDVAVRVVATNRAGTGQPSTITTVHLRGR